MKYAQLTCSTAIALMVCLSHHLPCNAAVLVDDFITEPIPAQAIPSPGASFEGERQVYIHWASRIASHIINVADTFAIEDGQLFFDAPDDAVKTSVTLSYTLDHPIPVENASVEIDFNQVVSENLFFNRLPIRIDTYHGTDSVSWDFRFAEKNGQPFTAIMPLDTHADPGQMFDRVVLRFNAGLREQIYSEHNVDFAINQIRITPEPGTGAITLLAGLMLTRRRTKPSRY